MEPERNSSADSRFGWIPDLLLGQGNHFPSTVVWPLSRFGKISQVLFGNEAKGRRPGFTDKTIANLGRDQPTVDLILGAGSQCGDEALRPTDPIEFDQECVPGDFVAAQRLYARAGDQMLRN